jgi:hypothetical protein
MKKLIVFLCAALLAAALADALCGALLRLLFRYGRELFAILLILSVFVFKDEIIAWLFAPSKKTGDKENG